MNNIKISFSFIVFYTIFLSSILAQQSISVNYQGKIGFSKAYREALAFQGYSIPEVEWAYTLSISEGKSDYTLDSIVFRAVPEDFRTEIIWDRLSKRYNDKAFHYQRGVFTDGVCYQGEINYIKDVEIHRDKRRKILGLECYFAEYSIGERIYEVWYTEDLPYSDGPVQFYHLREIDIPLLPGLILEIDELTEGYSYKAVGISVESLRDLSDYTVKCDKILPIHKYDAITYRSLVEKYGKKLNSKNIIPNYWYSATR
ncbi:MAG: GLPGLI family protein [Ulvibacter sp.]|jgi:GLPGLI family protein